jgi:hypothetical protein
MSLHTDTGLSSAHEIATSGEGGEGGQEGEREKGEVKKISTFS